MKRNFLYLLSTRDHNHDFIAKAIGLIQATDKIELTVVLEGCVQSLGTWLTDKRRWGENGGNLGTILQFATATCQALSFLHSKGRVHGDLMPQTILVGIRMSLYCRVLIVFVTVGEPFY